MTFATDGIITRVIDVGASDKLVSIITNTRGRIGVMVKGGRSPSSKLTPISQLFTYGNFEIYEKNSMYWLRGGSVTDSFYNLSTDVSKVALAAYLCDLANEMSDEDEECGELLRLLLNSLFLIGKGDKEQALIKAVFEFRAAAYSGYLPELSGCVYCGSGNADHLYLDVMGGRIICTDCLSKRGEKRPNISKEFDDLPSATVLCGISPSTLAALRYIAYAPANKIFSFELKDAADLRDLSKAAESYILNHLSRSFDSLDFYKAVL